MASNPSSAPAISHSVQITLRDGSTFTHTAQFARRIRDADDPALVGHASGIMVVEAVCCQGTPSETTSRHTFPNDISGYAAADIQAEIAAHVAKLAAHHASVHKAADFTDGLGQPAPSGQASGSGA